MTFNLCPCCVFRDEPAPLQVVLTGDQSPAGPDRQAPPLTSCLIKAPHPTPPSGGRPCSDHERTLRVPTSLPALSADTRNHTHLRSLAPPQVAAPPGLYERQPQATPPTLASTSEQTPPLSTCPSSNWSHLHQDQLHTGDPSVHPPVRTKSNSDSARSPTRWAWSSLLPGQEVGAAQPVERWAENVRGAHEELSDLDCVYWARLQAPSMHWGRGQATPTSGPTPGQNREEDRTH